MESSVSPSYFSLEFNCSCQYMCTQIVLSLLSLRFYSRLIESHARVTFAPVFGAIITKRYIFYRHKYYPVTMVQWLLQETLERIIINSNKMKVAKLPKCCASVRTVVLQSVRGPRRTIANPFWTILRERGGEGNRSWAVWKEVNRPWVLANFRQSFRFIPATVLQVDNKREWIALEAAIWRKKIEGGKKSRWLKFSRAWSSVSSNIIDPSRSHHSIIVPLLASALVSSLLISAEVLFFLAPRWGVETVSI